jgi:hypothetical protein
MRKLIGIDWRVAVVAASLAALAHAAQPGLDNRTLLLPYLNGQMPPTEQGTIPLLLSQTGAFANTPAMVPNAGLVPYGLNAPLWSDDSRKLRWMGLPYDGTANTPTVGNHPTGKWTFPNGTVVVKHFEMVVNEQTNTTKRLETRLLIRDANGGVFGRSYRWRADSSDADLVTEPTGQQEVLNIIGPDGSPKRTQTWQYPGPPQCLECHNNSNAMSDFGTGMVLGLKTRHMNGDFGYTTSNSTATVNRTANQLLTWQSLGMLGNALPLQDSYPELDRAVPLDDPNATLEHKVRSYVDNNCGFCHGGPGSTNTVWDGRYSTPLVQQNIAGDATLNPFAVLRRFDLINSRMYIRDSVDPRIDSFPTPMPPLARNIPHTNWLNVVSAWVNYPFDTTSAVAVGDPTKIKLKFDRALEPVSAQTAGNYGVTSGIMVTAATLNPMDASEVVLTVSAMTQDTNYRVAVNNVKESGNQSGGVLNPIWPNTWEEFTYLAAPIVQTISFPAIADKPHHTPPFNLTATGGASGNPVVFSSGTPDICTVSGANGATVTLTKKPGICTITASQAGGGTYAAANPVSRSFNVTWNFVQALTSLQQSPVIFSVANGATGVLYDATTRELTLTVSYGGLEGMETSAAVHGPAARGSNGPVLFSLPLGATKSARFTLTPEQESQLIAGNLYVNVKSTAFPDGEIRGQLDFQAQTQRFVQVTVVPYMGNGAVIFEGSQVCMSTCTYLVDINVTVSVDASTTGAWTGCNANFFGTVAGTACVLSGQKSQKITATFGPVDVPGVPDIFQLQTGILHASFAALAQGRGSEITGYEANCAGPSGPVQASSAFGSFVMTFPSNATYDCTVTATNAANQSTTSPVFQVKLLKIVKITSRKWHAGFVDPFDLDLTENFSSNSHKIVEPRAAKGGSHLIVLEFDTEDFLPFAGIGVVNQAGTSVGSKSTLKNGKTLEFLASGLPEGFKGSIKITHLFYNSNLRSVQLPVAFQPGDVNSSQLVSAGDVAATKSRLGRPLNENGNFLFDLNLDGVIGNADVSFVKNRSGQRIP